jgi:hypothetical protein
MFIHLCMYMIIKKIDFLNVYSIEQVQVFAGEFRLRVSSLNLQADLINFAG